MDWWKWRAIAWEKRAPEFRELFIHEGPQRVPVMTFAPQHVTDTWRELGAAWCALPRHPAILEALAFVGDGTLVLPYAALQWERGDVPDRVVVEWAAQV